MQSEPTSTTRTLGDLLSPLAAQAEAALAQYLPEEASPEALTAGMQYCVEGGKRLRPALVYLAYNACGGGDDELAARCAAAIEMVHVYSLVHDDLPAMDDDALRRGRPTAHVKFGEAMAILIGDALLTRAMAAIAERGTASAALCVAELATGAGCSGMVAGQVADMELCEVADGLEGLESIHRRKTAALLVAALRMGALAAGASEAQLAALTTYGEKLGLAFQVFDDLLDVTASAAELGKTPGKDAAGGKQTMASLLGLDGAREFGERLTADAVAALAPLGGASEPLTLLAEYLTTRRN
ncbi:MAG: polyprenyl synthetase family protein [Phycisphaerales bacterium]|jgi:geranylgeranyl pyrophosphate synthase|nr:polyprenyl synthetase family protein [Phycisphaerales bacterium]MBT7171932.1 polyprenyl synthetase family protein [Phycisphaerales bacterium]